MKILKTFENFNNNNEIEIDFILDKINKNGIENLSKTDKEILTGIYKDDHIPVYYIENTIFNIINNEYRDNGNIDYFNDEENINDTLDEIEEEIDVNSYYLIPIFKNCLNIYKKVDLFFKSLDDDIDICHFFDGFVGYNISGAWFNGEKSAITKSFKEATETYDVFYDDDDEFDSIINKLVEIFN
jgi:hypothetical protein